jgi:serine/threonine protein phosphatase PrpC
MSDLQTPAASTPLPISVGAVSETGQREQNQDCMTAFPSPFGAVYVIADGMGGHRGGAQASRLVIDSFQHHLLSAPASSPARDALTLAVRLANVEVLERGKSGNPDLAGMGSTIVVALIRATDTGLELMTAHVGDSRVYLFRKGVLSLLTKDHTQVQWLIDNNELDEVSARNHPGASVLIRAIGHTVDLQVDISDPVPIFDDDEILLCSDGLSGFATAVDIRNTLEQSPEPTECAARLVQLALASGSNDNITVQILRIARPGTAPVPAAPVVPLAPAPAASWLEPERRPSRFRGLIILASVVILGAAAWFFRGAFFPSAPNPIELQQRIGKDSERNQADLETALAGQKAVDRDEKQAGCKDNDNRPICGLKGKYSDEVANFGSYGQSLNGLKSQADSFAVNPPSANRQQLITLRNNADALEKQIAKDKASLDSLEMQRKSAEGPAPVIQGNTRPQAPQPPPPAPRHRTTARQIAHDIHRDLSHVSPPDPPALTGSTSAMPR